MPEPRACHLPHSTALVCIDVDRLRHAEALQRRGADIVVSGITELGGRR